MASSSVWKEFFTSAGIPPHAADKYARTFADNRIAMDMIMELNKVRQGPRRTSSA